MNQADATNLARDICETWQLTASPRIWAEALAPMADYPAARRAYNELRRQHTGRDMTVGTYTAEYKRQRRLANAEAIQAVAADHCARCNDGTLTYQIIHNRHPYAKVARCTCPAGRTWTHILGPLPEWVPGNAINNWDRNGAQGTPCTPPTPHPETETA